MQKVDIFTTEDYDAAEALGKKITNLLGKEQQSVLVSTLAMTMVSTFGISQVVSEKEAAEAYFALLSAIGLQALDDHYRSKGQPSVTHLHRVH